MAEKLIQISSLMSCERTRWIVVNRGSVCLRSRHLLFCAAWVYFNTRKQASSITSVKSLLSPPFSSTPPHKTMFTLLCEKNV